MNEKLTKEREFDCGIIVSDIEPTTEFDKVITTKGEIKQEIETSNIAEIDSTLEDFASRQEGLDAPSIPLGIPDSMRLKKESELDDSVLTFEERKKYGYLTLKEKEEIDKEKKPFRVLKDFRYLSTGDIPSTQVADKGNVIFLTEKESEAYHSGLIELLVRPKDASTPKEKESLEAYEGWLNENRFSPHIGDIILDNKMYRLISEFKNK